MGMLRRFSETIKPRDIIVLRIGTQNVYGVGEVVGPYLWDARFEDVQGWGLQHVRRVRWLWHKSGQPMTFPSYSLKLGSTVQTLDSPAVLAWLESLPVTDGEYARALRPLPSENS